MILESYEDILRDQMTTTATRQRFEEARLRHPALIPFEGPLAVVAFLHIRDREQAEARSEVTCAILTEVQQAQDSCWCALLILAFLPGLEHLRNRLQPNEADPNDYLVLESFIEVAYHLPLETQGRHAVLNLMKKTHRTVFRNLQRRSAEELLSQPMDDAIDGVAGNYTPESLLLKREKRALYSREGIEAWLHRLCPNKADVHLLMNTYGAHRSLIDYVAERFGDCDLEELLLIYERYRRRRSRQLARLRQRLSQDGTFCPARSRRTLEAFLLESSANPSEDEVEVAFFEKLVPLAFGGASIPGETYEGRTNRG